MSSMSSTAKSPKPFIVLREFMTGRHKVASGFIGVFLDNDQTHGRIMDLPSRPEVLVRRNVVRLLSRRESAFLYGIGSPQRRLHLLANEKLFLAVCALQISDVVRVRYRGYAAVGVATGIWELSEKSGLCELTKLLVEIELLDGEFNDNATPLIKIDAGDVLAVSSSIQRYPQYRGNGPRLEEEDMYSVLEDSLKDHPPVHESDVQEKMVGQRKGIQGHYNSCYLDTTLFSLFAFSSALDHILRSPDVCDAKVQRILRQDIVNPLRRSGFVHAENVMKLRKLLRCDTFVTEEKDPEEFLSALLHEVLAVEPLLKIRCNNKTQECNSYQIIVERDGTLKVPSVQTLMDRSFRFYENLTFDQVPSCLILQMPRFGKKFKMFPYIFPSLELDINHMLHKRSMVCCLCLSSAEYECTQCLADPLTTDGNVRQFCQLCEEQVHSSNQMKDHKPTRLETQTNVSNQKQKLELLAVLCIKTSHFVSFVKYGPGKNSWVFFDSMAGRIGNEIGTNVPVVRPCPQLGDYLSMSEEEFSAVDFTKMDALPKRFFSDIYMCIYQCPDRSMQSG
ncbi:ubiquitin carboxyl-terminal hydrolase CYLD-like [Bufo gargarizans]|uniref:ubiquitin carboxyl-terminal hydrolase CYLD-like n=1 Tax=Bufo gargarizans TaxID=30331 RepID=UPI001CF320B8|nr:ubiquitin carboxyl-terminal hydrolase CYLD-like [Bufo gargarizans]